MTPTKKSHKKPPSSPIQDIFSDRFIPMRKLSDLSQTLYDIDKEAKYNTPKTEPFTAQEKNNLMYENLLET